MGILRRIRSIWEDREFPVSYPGYFCRGDRITYNGKEKIVTENILLRSQKELIDYVQKKENT
jgi:hypothetical protein